MLNAENNRDFEARIRDAAQRSLDKEVAAFDALDPDAAAVSAKTERRILRAIHTLRTPRTHRTRLRRIAEGALQLGDLKPGQSRALTEQELTALRREIEK